MGLQDRDYMRARPGSLSSIPPRRPKAGWFARLGFLLWDLWRRIRRGLGWMLLTGLFVPLANNLRAAVPVDQIPLFQWRGRIVTTGGVERTDDAVSSISLFRVSVLATGGSWSAWREFDREQAEISVGPHSYPNSYMRGFPLVLHWGSDRTTFPADVEVEISFVETPEEGVRLHGRLGGRRLGVLVWREDGKPRAATMRDYNRQRYWTVFDRADVAPSERPMRFPIADRFIPGDDEETALAEGVLTLVKGGFNTLLMDPSPRNRALLERTGLTRITWAVYNPPGYAFDYGGVHSETIEEFAQSLAQKYRDAGFAPEQMALFTMSDEPGWYYPAMFRALTNSPAGLSRFREYLRARNLSPRDLGHRRWEDVCPLARSRAHQGGVSFGGYVIPRTAGDRTEGILQKILTLVGCGGKAIKNFVFGPEYNFPGNCYSENVRVLPTMAEAHRLIGRAEALLWPVWDAGVTPPVRVWTGNLSKRWCWFLRGVWP